MDEHRRLVARKLPGLGAQLRRPPSGRSGCAPRRAMLDRLRVQQARAASSLPDLELDRLGDEVRAPSLSARIAVSMLPRAVITATRRAHRSVWMYSTSSSPVAVGQAHVGQAQPVAALGQQRAPRPPNPPCRKASPMRISEARAVPRCRPRHRRQGRQRHRAIAAVDLGHMAAGSRWG